MQFILSVIGFFFLLFTAGMAYIVWKVRKRVINLRDAMRDSMDDETFRRMADKNYNRNHGDDIPPFEDDYFKGNPNGSKKQQQQSNTHTRRTTRTANGVTIIDDRDPSVANKKIFAKDEGEYVDFKEA